MDRRPFPRRAARAPARRRRSPLPVAIAALTLVAAGWWAAWGAEPAHGRQSVTIVSPAAGAETTARAVVARVRVRGPARAFRAIATAGGRERDVTRRFRRAGSRWTARLLVGRDLRAGANSLLVTVRRPNGRLAADSAHFRSAPRRARLIRALRVRRGGGAPVRVELLVSAKVDALRARLNGRGVGPELRRAGPRRWVAELGANRGARFGRNVLAVTAIDRSGARHQHARKAFRVPRDRPLAGAGPDGVVRGGAPIRLDGRSSRPHVPGGELRMRWRILRRPAGSAARLRGATGARPRLVGAAPGRYEIELAATSPGTAGAATGRDRVRLAVQPAALPSGVPVQTVVSTSSPGIQVGPTLYAAASGAVQMLVLDRATLAPAAGVTGGANQTFPGTDAGMRALAAAVPTDDEYLVLLANPPGRSMQLGSQGISALRSVVAGLGGTFMQTGAGDWGTALAGGGWSLIGVPGLPQGQASSLFGLQQAAGQPVGAMSGSFVIDSTGVNYEFQWPFAFVPFDTQAPGSTPTQNVISVAGATYTSQAVPAGQAAFQVVALDAGTLEPRSQATIAAGGDPTALASTLGALASAADPALVLVTSIGAPAVTQGPAVDAAGWPAVAGSVDALGGNPWALLALDGSGGYSLVGATALGQGGPNLGAELSQPLAPGAGSPRLTGVLERSPQGTWRPGIGGSPSAATSPAALQPEILQVLAQPPQPFTPFSTPALQAAEACINQGLGLGPLDPTWGIRANYWLDDDIQWGEKQAELQGLQPCAGVSATAFASVRATLNAEFGQVATVRGYLTGGGSADLDGILLGAVADSSFGFDAVYARIQSLYHPSGTARGPNGLGLMGAMLSGSAALAGPIAPFVTVVAAAVNIGGQIANDQSGAAVMGETVFEASAAQFASTLETDWQAAAAGLDHVADLLVSDAGRLQAASARIDISGSAGGWGLDTASLAQLDARLDRGIAQYTWYSLLPVAMYSYQCVVPPPAGSWYHEQGDTPSRAKFPVVAAVDNHQGGTQIATGFLSLARPGDSPDFPSQSVIDTLFGTQTGQLGLQPQYFLRAATQAGGTRASAGFTLNEGSWYDYIKDGFYLYDCAADSWQWNVE